MISATDLETAVYEAHRLAATVLPTDVRLAFERMHQRETEKLPQRVMHEILDNVSIAEADQRPICADVGVPRLYVVVGDNCELKDGFVQFERAARQATARVTKDLAMRSNRCHPLTRENPGHNVGVFAPNIEYRFEPDVDWIEIIAVHKGGAFGSDFRMLVDGDGVDGIRKGLLDAVAEFGRRGLTCPPVTIGVGIGGTKDQAFAIAKQAAQLRPVGDRHPDPIVAELEDELHELVDGLGLGAMGYPGSGGYATDVHIEIAYTHSALTPLGIHQLCQAARRAVIRVKADASMETRNVPAWFSKYSRREDVQ
ncbi:MAG: fumarate hydratase [Rhodospirillaceae bacterium]|nr:fumarate hydratase [Rhodospirillaceae bacterium]|tara:strand:+ start:524 stop:1456 length:933 start_codon:yes stop_codon:yes gene_type:complete